MIDLIVVLGLFGVLGVCGIGSFLLWIRLERPLKMEGMTFLDTAREDEKQLRREIPELHRHWNEYQRLLGSITKQEWRKGSIRPGEPIRAVLYHYIVPFLWKRKVAKCDKHRNDYDMLLKLHLRHEEESFVAHS